MFWQPGSCLELAQWPPVSKLADFSPKSEEPTSSRVSQLKKASLRFSWQIVGGLMSGSLRDPSEMVAWVVGITSVEVEEEQLIFIGHDTVASGVMEIESAGMPMAVVVILVLVLVLGVSS